MSEKSFSGSLALSKLKHVILEKKGKSGTIKGIFIPLEANKLTEGKEGAVYLGIRGVIKDEKDQYDNNGWVAANPNMGKKWGDLNDAEKEEAKSLSPIIGNVKVWGGESVGSDNSGAESSNVLDETDTLPF